MTDHVATRHKLKAIPTIATFTELVDSCTLDETDKQILNLHYLKSKDFAFIGDTLGFSEQAVKIRHRKILRKIGKII